MWVKSPTKLFKPDPAGDKPRPAFTPRYSGTPYNPQGAVGSGRDIPLRQVACYNCQKSGNMSTNCPSPRKFGGYPQTSAKRVADMEHSLVAPSGSMKGGKILTESLPIQKHSAVDCSVKCGQSQTVDVSVTRLVQMMFCMMVMLWLKSLLTRLLLAIHSHICHL